MRRTLFEWRATASEMVRLSFIHLVSVRLVMAGLLSTGMLCAGTIRLELPFRSDLARRGYNLESREDVRQLVADTSEWVRQSENQAAAWETQRTAFTAAAPLADSDSKSLRAYFSEPTESITKREQRGLKAIRRLAGLVLETEDPRVRSDALTGIQEVAAALRNGRRPPAPRNLDTLQIPFVLIDHLTSPVARGRRPASNLASRAEVTTDLDLHDPGSSTFWSRPESIRTLDLYHGFGRREMPQLEGVTCIYEGPKTSYGGNPGFDVRYGDLRVKAKFGETTSEPFTARLFWALGYHVDPTDHARQLRVRYDRRLFREFNLRRDILTTFRIFWFVPVHTINLQRYHDPFECIAAAVLKDGTRISGSDLKRRLFHRPRIGRPEDDPANFKTEFEPQIDHLVTVPANLQYRDKAVDSIGPWDFGQLGHEDRRELRGAGLLAAWIGWYDSRLDNTRLKTVEREAGKQLLHYFADLGGTLGRGHGFYSGRGELPHEFEWTFTRRNDLRRIHPRAAPFQITGFKPIEKTPAFREMTVDDARWMARLIAQLTEEQLAHALMASGFDSAHIRFYVEKLISRRDRMIVDLGLGESLKLLRPDGVDRSFTYVPARDGKVSVTFADGRRISARDSDTLVAEGRLVRVNVPDPVGSGWAAVKEAWR